MSSPKARRKPSLPVSARTPDWPFYWCRCESTRRGGRCVGCRNKAAKEAGY